MHKDPGTASPNSRQIEVCCMPVVNLDVHRWQEILFSLMPDLKDVGMALAGILEQRNSLIALKGLP
jgi:hypothetical protein